MPRKQRIVDDEPGTPMILNAPAPKTIEGNENRIANKAIKAIENRIDSGEATAQELLFFAKLGTKDYWLEKEIKEKQKMLLDAKTSSIKQSQQNQKLVSDALKAFKMYWPSSRTDDEAEEEY